MADGGGAFDGLGCAATTNLRQLAPNGRGEVSNPSCESHIVTREVPKAPSTANAVDAFTAVNAHRANEAITTATAVISNGTAHIPSSTGASKLESTCERVSNKVIGAFIDKLTSPSNFSAATTVEKSDDIAVGQLDPIGGHISGDSKIRPCGSDQNNDYVSPLRSETQKVATPEKSPKTNSATNLDREISLLNRRLAEVKGRVIVESVPAQVVVGGEQIEKLAGVVKSLLAAPEAATGTTTCTSAAASQALRFCEPEVIFTSSSGASSAAESPEIQSQECQRAQCSGAGDPKTAGGTQCGPCHQHFRCVDEGYAWAEKPVEQWDASLLVEFLSAHSAVPEDLVDLIQKHAISGAVFLSLHEKDLVEIGVCKFGHRRLLKLGASSLRDFIRRKAFHNALSASIGTPQPVDKSVGQQSILQSCSLDVARGHPPTPVQYCHKNSSHCPEMRPQLSWAPSAPSLVNTKNSHVSPCRIAQSSSQGDCGNQTGSSQTMATHMHALSSRRSPSPSVTVISRSMGWQASPAQAVPRRLPNATVVAAGSPAKQPTALSSRSPVGAPVAAGGRLPLASHRLDGAVATIPTALTTSKNDASYVNDEGAVITRL